MKTKVSRTIAMVLFVSMVLFAVLGSHRGLAGEQEWGTCLSRGQHTMERGDAGQSLKEGGGERTSAPEGMLATESKTVSFVKSGRAEEESADLSIFLLSVFLVISLFQLFMDGRPWSVVQSICMGFQDYAMHQISILQLWDGKKEVFSYSY